MISKWQCAQTENESERARERERESESERETERERVERIRWCPRTLSLLARISGAVPGARGVPAGAGPAAQRESDTLRGVCTRRVRAAEFGW